VDTILEHRLGEATGHGADSAATLVDMQVYDLLDTLGEACYTVDEHWRISALNRTAEALWGEFHDQLVGINPRKEFPQVVGAPANRELMAAMRERRPVAFEYCIPALDRWFDVRAYPSGTGLTLFLRDSTTRKQAEIEREQLLAALDASRRMLQGIAEASPDLHYIFDLESGCAIYVSARSEQIFGYTTAGLMDLGAQLVPTLVHPDDLPSVMEHLQALQTLADREIYTFELRSLYPDGTYHWLHTSASVYLRGGDGQVRQVIGVTCDITTRKQAEIERERLLVELDKSRRLFQRIAETSPDALYVFDLPTGQTIYLSARSQQTIGYTAEEITALGARFAATYWHPDDLRDMAQHRQALRELANDAIYECEYRVRQADGTYRWVRTRSSVFARADDGQVQQIIGVTQDITARKQAEADLRQCNSTDPTPA
jgi:PAS domain S-box-containing protein